MRAMLMTLGVLSALAAWLGPLPALTRDSFTAHMTLHMSIVAVSAPLIAFGLAGSRWDPTQARPSWFQAVQVSMVDLCVIWAWHVPAIHLAARQSFRVLVLEQASFFAAALWLWVSAVGGGSADQASARRGAGIVALLFTLMHMTLLGALLALAPRPLYRHPGGADEALALVDQHWGGAIMLIGGSVAYIAGALVLTVRLLSGGVRHSRPVSS